VPCLKKQAGEKGLLNYKEITLIGNADYQERIYEVFSNPNVKIKCPVKNLMQEEDICLKINQLLLEEKTDQ
jgi:hypothetical protein